MGLLPYCIPDVGTTLFSGCNTTLQVQGSHAPHNVDTKITLINLCDLSFRPWVYEIIILAYLASYVWPLDFIGKMSLFSVGRFVN